MLSHARNGRYSVCHGCGWSHSEKGRLRQSLTSAFSVKTKRKRSGPANTSGANTSISGATRSAPEMRHSKSTTCRRTRGARAVAAERPERASALAAVREASTSCDGERHRQKPTSTTCCNGKVLRGHVPENIEKCQILPSKSSKQGSPEGSVDALMCRCSPSLKWFHRLQA